MEKSFVLYSLGSPPAAACCTTTRLTGTEDPRSTCKNLVASSEHHLSELPPVTLPFTAFSGPSAAPHAALDVATLLRAKSCAGAGALLKPYTERAFEKEDTY